MKNSNFLIKDIRTVKENIKYTYPYAKDVKVSLAKNECGEYRTVIRVRVPRRKEYVAVKSHYDPHICLEKTQRAIISQISKVKSHWKKVRNEAIKTMMVA